MLIKYTKIEKIKFKEDNVDNIEKIEDEIIKKITEKYPNLDLTIESIELSGRKITEYEEIPNFGYPDYRRITVEQLMSEATVILSQTLPQNQKPEDPEFKRISINWINL